MFNLSVSPILSEIESRFLLMKSSPRDSHEVVLEVFDITLFELTVFMRKKYEIKT